MAFATTAERRRPVMDQRRQTAERLGVRFFTCAECKLDSVWREVFSVMFNRPGGDYDDGSSDIQFCCSHACASRCLSTKDGFVSVTSDGVVFRPTDGGK